MWEDSTQNSTKKNYFTQYGNKKNISFKMVSKQLFP